VICKKGFVPHARQGERQRTCGEASCRKALRQRSQASWRKRHPGYFIAWRAKRRGARNEKEPVEAPRVPAPLEGLPWELAQEEFGVIGADFLGSLVRKLVEAKSSIRSQPLETTKESGQVATGVAKSSFQSQPLETTKEIGQVATGVAKSSI
jgi:hypothetical protein